MLFRVVFITQTPGLVEYYKSNSALLSHSRAIMSQRILGWTEREWTVQLLRPLLTHYDGERELPTSKVGLLERLEGLVRREGWRESHRARVLRRAAVMLCSFLPAENIDTYYDFTARGQASKRSLSKVQPTEHWEKASTLRCL